MNARDKDDEDNENEKLTSTSVAGTNIRELTTIDDDLKVLEQLSSIGNVEEDLRACLEAELTPDRDDVLRGQGLGPNTGPLPHNIANPILTPRLPLNIAEPIDPSFLTEVDRLTEYSKAIDLVTINPEQRLRIKVKQLTIRSDKLEEL